MKTQEIEDLCRELADRGKIIEAGWLSLKMTTIPADAPQVQLDEMRNAFFAGAQHLFGSIMGLLEGGEEATEKDIRRLSLINSELNSFLDEFKAKHLKAGGRA
jgi:hypothetical protein